MRTYNTESGYTAIETLGGVDIYEGDCYVCSLDGISLTHFEDENGNINEDELDEEINDVMLAEDFLNYQKEYC